MKLKYKHFFILILVGYLVAWIVLIPYFRYQINPDGVSYISIAQKYAHGHFADAVNGYWAPFYCWLMAPFIFIGIEPLLAAKIAIVCTGVLAIVQMNRFTSQFNLSNAIRGLVLLSSIPLILTASIRLITPDFIVASLLLGYFLNMFRPEYSEKPRYALLAGFWASLSYLAKNYAFPFFILHFSLMTVLHLIRCKSKHQKRLVLRSFLYGAGTFAVISSLWITAISLKYDRLTFSTAGKFNTRLYGPKSEGIPVFRQGLLAPPNDTAICLWEDPSCLESMLSPWSPLNSMEEFKYQMELVWKNLSKLKKAFWSFSSLYILIFFCYGLLALQNPKTLVTKPRILYPLVSVLLFSSGYCLVLVETRYIYVTGFLLLLMGGYILDRLFKNGFFTTPRKAIICFVFFVSCAYQPIMKEFPRRINSGKGYVFMSRQLKQHIPAGARIASNDQWADSFYLAFHLNARYYGMPKKNLTEEQLNERLLAHGIEYYLVWKNNRLVGVQEIKP